MSYEKSLKLFEKKFPQNGFFWWVPTKNKLAQMIWPKTLLPWYKIGFKKNLDQTFNILAPMASELIKKLPQEFPFHNGASTVSRYISPYTKGFLVIYKRGKEYVISYVDVNENSLVEYTNKVFVEALGDMVLFLSEWGLSLSSSKPIIKKN